MKTYMVKPAFIIINIFFMCFLFLFCVYFHFYIFLFKKRSKYVALDFSADFLIFIFYFVYSFLLI
jgi:hypothetical protein